MGFNLWNNSTSPATSSEKRGEKNDLNRPKKQISLFWMILALGSLLFFISSLSKNFSVEKFFILIFPWVSLIMAIFLVIFEIKESKLRKFQRQKRKEMMIIFEKQKRELKTLFDIKKNISEEKEKQDEKQKSKTNFVTLSEEETKEAERKEIDRQIKMEKSLAGINILDFREEEEEKIPASEEKKVFDKKVVEGEKITDFPSQWQEYFIENEGKNPAEKLSKMLES